MSTDDERSCSGILRCASSTSKSSWRHKSAACSTAARQSGCTSASLNAARTTPTRSLPGSRPASSAHGRSGGGAKYGAPASGPAVQSSSSALSRTLFETAWIVLIPAQPSPTSGPIGVRPRVGFSPNSPVHDAGIRIDPPPSEAFAIGSTPAAVSADAPPEEPPDVCSRFHGLRVFPCSSDSVVAVSPNSGEVLRPKMLSPAAL